MCNLSEVELKTSDRIMRVVTMSIIYRRHPKRRSDVQFCQARKTFQEFNNRIKFWSRSLENQNPHVVHGCSETFQNHFLAFSERVQDLHFLCAGYPDEQRGASAISTITAPECDQSFQARGILDDYLNPVAILDDPERW